ncbi:unnamed protein product [Clonostachys rhizophaga]|uniref:Uncharacterized protein n=1 Tax=Clonostachys rhizophaga TaxID=160324 RepID=A0A9N9YS62_9HYPO|nr:unnamed protein product [Clonostachys rhizophaga]
MRFYHIFAFAIASTVMASPAAIAEVVDVDVRSTDSNVAEAFESREDKCLYRYCKTAKDCCPRMACYTKSSSCVY